VVRLRRRVLIAAGRHTNGAGRLGTIVSKSPIAEEWSPCDEEACQYSNAIPSVCDDQTKLRSVLKPNRPGSTTLRKLTGTVSERRSVSLLAGLTYESFQRGSTRSTLGRFDPRRGCAPSTLARDSAGDHALGRSFCEGQTSHLPSVESACARRLPDSSLKCVACS
jgi:hypothetical protein